MKKLIFIDNDNLKRAEDDVNSVKSVLEHFGNLKKEYVDTIEIMPEFGTLEKDDVYKIIFDKRNCICTWSMYTANHYGSLYQLTKLLTAAGTNEIQDLIYIDASRMIEKALENELQHIEKPLPLLNAIETNNIISFDLEKDLCFRIRVDFKGEYKGYFKREEINLGKLLEVE